MSTVDALRAITDASDQTWPGWKWSNHETAGGYAHHQPNARMVCAAAKLEADVGILACALASEFRQNYPIELLAGAHAILNDCHDRIPQISVESRVTMLGLRRKWKDLWTTYPAAGFFGRQSGRWCSSWAVPSFKTVVAARAALAGEGVELALGARRWVDGHVQDGGWQAGKRLSSDAETVVRSRYEEGWKWIGPTKGIDSYRLILLAKRGRSLVEALAMISAGRAARNT